MKTIGFIGLGIMGLPMAENLLKHGYPLVVYNRTAEKADELVRKGAELAATPADAARSAEVLITMISNDQALRDVFLGQGGITEGLHPGLVVIDCSTVSPELSRHLNRTLSAHYAEFLDAPVTGSKPAAIDGTLTFMVGGSHETYEEHLEIFQAMGKKTLYMGPSGSGSQTKLAHNTIVAINTTALAEGLAIAAKSGIDPERFLEVVQNGAAASRQAELKAERILSRDYSAQFALQLMLKDLNLAADLTTRLHMPSPLMQAARSIFQIADSKGLGTSDLSAVIQCYEEWIQTEIKRNSGPATQKPEAERRRNIRIPMGLELKLSVYQWEQEGAFSGQLIDGTLHDLSESGLQLSSEFPLAQDMFVVIHFPQEAELPPITGKIIRVVTNQNGRFQYGCMMSGIPLYTQIKLENYIKRHIQEHAH